MECRLGRITVHYESLGEGRPFVMLPGWPDDWRVPADYLEPVFRRRPGWRRIYIDLPGRGRTRGEPWITGNDQILEIVLEALDHIAPGERVVLGGHSMGAYLARAVLRHRADRIDGLLQVVPVVDPDDEDLPAHETLVADEDLIRRIGVELGPDAASLFAGNVVAQTPFVYEHFKALLPAMRPNDASFLARLVGTLSDPVDPPPAPFARPALFVLGRQDSQVGFRSALRLVDAYPRATIAVLDRAGHAAAWEQEGVLGVLVSEWLTRIEQEVLP
jgi:pimeloyl-ACP methyl ester carboxylesterase